MKNFKEFIKEQNENTLDEGFVDALKSLGKGLLHYSGAALGAVGGGIKSGFRAIAGGKDEGGHGHNSHKYDTWKRDARADADRYPAGRPGLPALCQRRRQRGQRVQDADHCLPQRFGCTAAGCGRSGGRGRECPQSRYLQRPAGRAGQHHQAAGGQCHRGSGPHRQPDAGTAGGAAQGRRAGHPDGYHLLHPQLGA